jgi:type II secretory pathway predicted ATPase ExeA
MDNLKHLAPATKEIINLSVEERIDFIKSPKWIGYSTANEILMELLETLSQPKSHRMRNLLLIGSTNNGKTMIMNRFLQKFGASDNVDGEAVNVPIVIVQAPPVPDENRLYNNILESIFAMYNPKEHVSTKQLRVINLLKRLNTRMLIIDELHHILSDSLAKQRRFLNVIKFISNELQIPIVGVGTKDALRAIQSDPQLENRFEPAVLPLWKHNNDFKKLLASFEALLPLREASNLASEKISSKLLMLSEGTIGELANVINKVAIVALKRGDERITLKLIDSLNLNSPTQRRKKASSTAI